MEQGTPFLLTSPPVSHTFSRMSKTEQKMKRVTFDIEPKQLNRADKLAKVKGFKRALLIRLAVKDYLDKEEARETA